MFLFLLLVLTLVRGDLSTRCSMAESASTCNVDYFKSNLQCISEMAEGSGDAHCNLGLSTLKSCCSDGTVCEMTTSEFGNILYSSLCVLDPCDSTSDKQAILDNYMDNYTCHDLICLGYLTCGLSTGVIVGIVIGVVVLLGVIGFICWRCCCRKTAQKDYQQVPSAPLQSQPQFASNQQYQPPTQYQSQQQYPQPAPYQQYQPPTQYQQL